MVAQSLQCGSVRLSSLDQQPTPYYLAGRHLYAIGMTDGTFGPVGDEHLVGEMGGVWAHPIKFLDGWHLALLNDTNEYETMRCDTFEGHLSDVVMHYHKGPVHIERSDFVATDSAVLACLLRITNQSQMSWSGTLCLVSQVNILPSWFSGWTAGQVMLEAAKAHVSGTSSEHQDEWGFVLGSLVAPNIVLVGNAGEKQQIIFQFTVDLEANQTAEHEVMLVCEHKHGWKQAERNYIAVRGAGYRLRDQARRRFHLLMTEGVVLQTPNDRINEGWMLAKANVDLLTAELQPYLEPYLAAGIPEYPHLFGCDSTYSVPGVTGAGFHHVAGSTLRLLGQYAERACGRVPHEITTNGRVFHPGNTQETPQLAIAVWDYVRWTGDRDFLEAMYPVCQQGVMQYVPAFWSSAIEGYPTGDAMVERGGMGPMKLDSTCYLGESWRSLAAMAQALKRPEVAEYVERDTAWRQRFERDWWIEAQSLYADSLHSNGRQQLDGHWTQVIPIQLGIASQERAEMVLDGLERDFINCWGLVHTRDQEERVWTLPTGLLALAAAKHGRADWAVDLLSNIAITTHYGMLGTFKELIPQGLCFVQLWSAGLLLQGVLEGLCGLSPVALEHRLTIQPALPDSWPTIQLTGLYIGEHRLDLTLANTWCEIKHQAGPQAMFIELLVGSSHPPIRCSQLIPVGDVARLSAPSEEH